MLGKTLLLFDPLASNSAGQTKLCLLLDAPTSSDVVVGAPASSDNLLKQVFYYSVSRMCSLNTGYICCWAENTVCECVL